jgi:hypothetical protein
VQCLASVLKAKVVSVRPEQNNTPTVDESLEVLMTTVRFDHDITCTLHQKQSIVTT